MRRSIYILLVCFTALVVIALRAEALEPEQVFEKASSSVVTVVTMDAGGAIVASGSGVVIAPGEIITNCHVVEDGAKWRVEKAGRTSPAYRRFYDEQRDLCQLHAPRVSSFTRPIRGLVAMDDLKVGQRVYAIGGPQGFELTLSEGLISGLRQFENGFSQLIQTTAPISPGSSGGGLFDQDGRLVGITTFLLEESQNLNFALPASWVLELPSRQADLIEQSRKERAEQRAVAAAAELRCQGELAAAKAALLEERRSLDAEPAAKKADPIQDFYKDMNKGQNKDAGPQPVTLSQTPGAPPLPVAPKSSSADEEAVLKRYARDISRIIGKSTSESDYPRLARQNGWEGTPEVRLVIGADGHVKDVLIATGSDYAVLDERAIEMVKQVLLPKIPSIFRGREFSITVPIAFILGKP